MSPRPNGDLAAQVGAGAWVAGSGQVRSFDCGESLVRDDRSQSTADIGKRRPSETTYPTQPFDEIPQQSSSMADLMVADRPAASTSRSFNLDSAVGHARVGCDAVRQQGATTLRAHAREEEQRRWRAVAQLNRACSALTQVVNVIVSTKLSVHAVWPAVSSGQLRNLG